MKFKSLLLLLLAFTLHSFGKSIVYGYAAYYEADPTLEQIDALDYLGFGCFPPVNIEGDIMNPWGKERLHILIEHAKSVGTKSMLSFGGGNVVLPAELIVNDANRHRLISKSMDLMEEFGFDGFDNDWEPDYNSSKNDSILLINNRAMRDYYTIFMKEVRDSLDARFGAGEKVLTAAVSKQPEHFYWQNMIGHKEVCYADSFWVHCDYVFVMSFGQQPGRNYGNVDDCFDLVANWQDFGVPDEKLIPGIGFWGMAQWGEMRSYHLLVDILGSNDSSATYVTYDFGPGTMDYGFNNIAGVKAKHARSKELGFGGIGVNSIGGDVPFDHPMSLLRAVTEYESTEKVVKLETPIDTLKYSFSFVDTILLSNHFSTTTGSLNYRIVGTLKRHQAVISDDTLFLTGDGVEMNSLGDFVIRASRTGVPTDFVDYKLVLIVDNRIDIEEVESPNLVLSSPWATFQSDEQILLPAADTQLRTVQLGDTIINMQSNIPTSFTSWSWLTLRPTVLDETTFDLTRNRVIVEYQSTMIENNQNLTMSFLDTSGAYHTFDLSADPGKWICDTIDAADLRKGYLQPETIDLTQIDTVFFNIGGNRGGTYSFSVRNFRIEAVSGAAVAKSSGKSQLCEIRSVNKGILNLNHRFSSEHELTIIDLRGRELFRKAITAGTGTTAIALPMARGIYLAQISGAQFNRSWKLNMQ